MRSRTWSLILIISLLALGFGLTACNNEEPEVVLEPEVTEPYVDETVVVEPEIENGEGLLESEPLVEGEPIEPGMEQEAPAEAPIQ